jgi:hypothetical protein
MGLRDISDEAVQRLSVTIGATRSPAARPPIPDYPTVRPRRAHSSIFGYVNALIFQRNFFRSRGAIRTANRQKFLVLIFNRKSRDSDSTRFQRLSTTIGRFFASSTTQRIARQREKYRHRSSTISNHSPSARTPSFSLSTISTA